MIRLGSHRINLYALVARMAYRRSWQALSVLSLLSLIFSVGFGSGLIPPWWRGKGTLTIEIPQGTSVRVDGLAWSTTNELWAGRHAIDISAPETYPGSQVVEVRPTQRQPYRLRHSSVARGG